MWENVTQGQGVPDPQVLPIGGAQHFAVGFFCPVHAVCRQQRLLEGHISMTFGEGGPEICHSEPTGCSSSLGRTGSATH